MHQARVGHSRWRKGQWSMSTVVSLALMQRASIKGEPEERVTSQSRSARRLHGGGFDVWEPGNYSCWVPMLMLGWLWIYPTRSISADELIETTALELPAQFFPKLVFGP